MIRVQTVEMPMIIIEPVLHAYRHESDTDDNQIGSTGMVLIVGGNISQETVWPVFTKLVKLLITTISMTASVSIYGQYSLNLLTDSKLVLTNSHYKCFT